MDHIIASEKVPSLVGGVSREGDVPEHPHKHIEDCDEIELPRDHLLHSSRARVLQLVESLEDVLVAGVAEDEERK